MSKPVKVAVSLLTVVLSGFLTLANLAEWYTVKIQKRISEYPFGTEGPVPYYYETPELYATVSLFWGICFFAILLFTIWTIIEGRRALILLSLGTTLIFLLGLFIHGQIGTN